MGAKASQRLLVIGQPLFLQRLHPLTDELARRVGALDVTAIEPPGAERTRRFVRPLRGAWRRAKSTFPLAASLASAYRARSQGPAAFLARSERARRAILERTPEPDVVLQIFSLFSAHYRGARFRHAAYLDYTTALARRRWPAWARADSEAEFDAWLELERALYRGAARLFPASEVVRDSLVRDYGAEPHRITVVGASGEFSEPYSGTKAYGTQRLIFNGSDFSRKRGDLVVAAFEQVRSTFPAATLTVVGDCPCPRRPGIDVRGAVARPELDRLLGSADVLLAPSDCDPFPGFVIEGMNFGAVPIVSAADGLPEIVRQGETGFVVPEPTPESLAGHVKTLFADPDLQRRMSDASRRRVAERFLWSHVAGAIVSTLELAGAAAGREGIPSAAQGVPAT